MGEFYYGDNLDVLRGRAIKDESVDLVYLDPPFNSQRTYNVIHRENDGSQSEAQRRAFEDSWTMDAKAQDALSYLTLPGKDRWKVPTQVSETYEMLQRILGSDGTMLAYLAMMGVRLVELRRVMKETASLYLHCDPTASHYLKLVLDTILGASQFRAEIIWKRYGAHNDVGQGARHYGRSHDVLLYYSKSDDFRYNPQFVPLSDVRIKEHYGMIEPGTGRAFTTSPLTGPGGAAKGNPVFEFKGHTRAWRYSKATMERLDAEGRFYYSKTGYPRQKKYLDESKGVPVQDLWTDIPPLIANAERVGYPTQKPVALMERIIATSSNEGDVVLDPFAGCGTTIEAAEKMKRRWIGIDITHLAVSVLRRRMHGKFPNLKLTVRGEPADAASAHALAKANPHEFQAWIVDKVGGAPLEASDDERVAKKGGDRGIDGVLLFRDDPKAVRSHRMVLSVKATASVSPNMVRELRGTMVREKATLAALLLLTDPTDGMRKEAKSDGQYKSESFKPVDKIQILSIADIFAGKTLEVPGMNTTHKSVPPAGAPGSSLELPFDKPKKLAKTKGVPAEQTALPIALSKRAR